MANVFQTTTGYRDPQKAMTIKALEARAKAAQEATTAAMQPQTIAAPEQGWAQMLGALGSNIQQGRAESEAVDARANLARVMSGINMDTGPDMAAIAQISTYDPELAKSMYDQAMKTRQENLSREDTQDFTAGESALEREQREKLEREKNALTVSENALSRGSSEKIATAGNVSSEGIADLNRQAEAARQRASDAAAAGRQDDQQAAAQELARIEAEIAKQSKQDETDIATANIPVANAAREKEADRLGLKPGSPERNEYVTTGEYTVHQALKPGDMYTPAEEAREKMLSEEAAEFETTGGPSAANDIQQVNKAIDLLQKGDITGFRQGVAANYFPSVVNSWYNPEGAVAMSAVQETVQNTLRQSLGAQFTEKEGVALMARAFAPELGEQENIRRAKLLLEQIASVAATKNAMVEHRKSHRDFIDFRAPDSSSGKARLRELLATDFGANGGGGNPTTTTTPPPAGGDPSIDELIRQANEP